MDLRPKCKSDNEDNSHEIDYAAPYDCYSKDQTFGSKKHQKKSIRTSQFFSTDSSCHFQCGIIMNKIGDQLNKGKYILQKELGKGVFSCVFKAINCVTKEKVVIKIYKSNGTKNDYNPHAKDEIEILKYLETIDQSADIFGIFI